MSVRMLSPVTCATCSQSYMIAHHSAEPVVLRHCPLCGARQLFWNDAAFGNNVFAWMEAKDDAVHVSQTHTAGVNLAIGCGALVKSVLGRLDPMSERKFLEEFITELRKPKVTP